MLYLSDKSLIRQLQVWNKRSEWINRRGWKDMGGWSSQNFRCSLFRCSVFRIKESVNKSLKNKKKPLKNKKIKTISFGSFKNFKTCASPRPVHFLQIYLANVGFVLICSCNMICGGFIYFVFGWGNHLYMSLSRSFHPFVVRHKYATVHHIIIIYGMLV